MASLTIGQAQAMQQGLQSLSDSPALDVSLLLCHVLNRPRSYLYTWPERELDGQQQALFEQLLARRLKGEPIAHILGVREFWSLPLAVSVDTLIPRPDSECLVEAALTLFAGSDSGALLDLGTGTGAIALALATERPAWQVCGVDRIEAAVRLAERNRLRLGLHNAAFTLSDWFAGLNGERFQMIVSNPPYLAQDEMQGIAPERALHEPAMALTDGADGLSVYRLIAGRAQPEHSSRQAAPVLQ